MNAPLLDDRRRAAVTDRVLEIAHALQRPHDEWVLSQRPDQSGLRTISLALGRAGTATFEAWLYRSGLDEAAGDRALGHLSTIVELLPSATMDLSLLCGFPGVAWTVEHLVEVLGLELGHDVNAAIDATILEALDDPATSPAYDLIDGLAGLALYALQRRDTASGARLLHEVLDRLEAASAPNRGGISWPTGAITRTAHRMEIPADEGYFNLGLSHGVPGAIASLARLHAHGDVRERIRPLLRASVDWLRDRRPAGDPGDGGLYPDFVADGVASEPARLAWCYGDPGVAATFVGAGRALDDPRLIDFGVEVAHAAARRDPTPEKSSVVDDGVCHGTAGLAHVFHRIHRATGDATCRDASLFWLDRLLERNDDVPNIAGCTTFCFERTLDGETIEDPAWLTGAAGVGLVLLSMLSDPDDRLPHWDGPLLLDLDFPTRFDPRP